MNRPTIQATRKRLMIHATVTYPSGQRTLYRCPLWFYGLAWIWARASGGSGPRVVSYLRRFAHILKPETLNHGTTAAERRAREIREDPGTLAGWAESLKG